MVTARAIDRLGIDLEAYGIILKCLKQDRAAYVWKSKSPNAVMLDGEIGRQERSVMDARNMRFRLQRRLDDAREKATEKALDTLEACIGTIEHWRGVDYRERIARIADKVLESEDESDIRAIIDHWALKHGLFPLDMGMVMKLEELIADCSVPDRISLYT